MHRRFLTCCERRVAAAGLIPEKLYGRSPETNALIKAFDRVVTEGKAELVLVSGYAGIGKSSVVKRTPQAPRRRAASSRRQVRSVQT